MSTHRPLAHSLAVRDPQRPRRAAPTSLGTHALSIADAYEAQAAVVHALGERVGGWKTGFGPDRHSVAAPLLAGRCSAAAHDRLPHDRPAILEIEIAFRLAHDLPPRPGRRIAREVRGGGGGVVGAELIAARGGCRRPGRRSRASWPTCRATRATCAAPRRATSARSTSTRSRSTLWIDGERVHGALGGHPQRDPWLPIVTWSNAQCDGSAASRRAR